MKSAKPTDLVLVAGRYRPEGSGVVLLLAVAKALAIAFGQAFWPFWVRRMPVGPGRLRSCMALGVTVAFFAASLVLYQGVLDQNIAWGAQIGGLLLTIIPLRLVSTSLVLSYMAVSSVSDLLRTILEVGLRFAGSGQSTSRSPFLWWEVAATVICAVVLLKQAFDTIRPRLSSGAGQAN